MTKKLLFLFSVLCLLSSLQATELKQSTAYHRMIFMASSSDHVTGATSLTLTITASKAGAAFGSISPTVTERGNGWYDLALTTSHTDTLGDLCLHITGTAADPADTRDVVIAWDKATALSSTTIGTVTSVTNGVTVTTNNDKTGYALTQSFPTNFSSLSIDGSGRMDAGKINGVSTSSVTTVNANVGTTQPINFTGTGSSAYAKVDVVDVGGAAQLITTRLDAAITSRSSISASDVWGYDISAPGAMGSSTIGKLLTDNINATISSRSSHSASDVWAVGTRALTDKAGFSLSVTPPTAAAIATAIWTDTIATSDFTGAGTIGKRIADDLDATVSSRSSITASDIWNVTLPSTYTGQKAGNLLWRIGNRPSP